MRQLITIMILISSIKVFGIEYKIDTVDIKSEILSETRKVYVFKPVDLTRSDSVIFIYLLDGEYSGYRYKKIQNEFPDKKIIGIGILNIDRRRDMLPDNQPDKFLGFIEKELIPNFEKDYNVINRILFGHSFAGGFVINSMIQSPGLFNKYIASSPTPIMDFIDSHKYLELDKDLSADIDFYFSYGSKDMKQVRKWGLKLNESLTTVKFEWVRWRNDIFEDKNHNNSDLICLVNGLKY